jgi:hypothetical protein
VYVLALHSPVAKILQNPVSELKRVVPCYKAYTTHEPSKNLDKAILWKASPEWNRGFD